MRTTIRSMSAILLTAVSGGVMAFSGTFFFEASPLLVSVSTTVTAAALGVFLNGIGWWA